jgi:hypothetical protein
VLSAEDLHNKGMRINYSLSPELYVDFLRTNFTTELRAEAIPVSAAASPDTLLALIARHRLPAEPVVAQEDWGRTNFSRS